MLKLQQQNNNEFEYEFRTNQKNRVVQLIRLFFVIFTNCKFT